MVKAFAKTHSANGSAVGTVKVSDKGTGSEKKIGGLDAYIAVPKKPFKSAVLVITDVYGYKTDNVRKWADQLAAEGFLAVIPDYFKGNPRKTTDSPESFAAWRALYPRERVVKETAAVLGDIRKLYPNVKNIGAEGFCWGGLYSVLLTQGKTPAVSAAVVYHGSLITKDDIEAINAPILFQQSDPALDRQMNTTTYNEFKTIIDAKRAKGLDTSMEFYPSQAHGFSLRGNEGNVTVAAAATSAFQKGAAFLKKYLSK
jgi:carboxymethylenebutenolidase